jgi:hypothetical protein
MDWTQSLTIIISNFGVLLVLFVYLMNRMDSNKKELEQKISSDIRDLKMDMKSDMHQQIEGVNQRITDLKVDMNQRLSTIEGYLVPRKVFHIEEPHKEEAKEN